MTSSTRPAFLSLWYSVYPRTRRAGQMFSELEAHHKKTILWNSECAKLASGRNFAARKALLEILESPDNSTDVLPAIPLLEPIPDGDLGLSIGGSNDSQSFNSMADPPSSGEQRDSAFVEREEGDYNPTEIVLQYMEPASQGPYYDLNPDFCYAAWRPPGPAEARAL
ncbi:hypothetical protein B0H13DRAFT_1887053 [Mycena leptocephala]|nr:hypothetical protein B0H13DRAFT_1887053 [Mycena leptocephala]